MKLIIRRSQAEEKGVFGKHKGMKFVLSCRVELTPEEQDLITKYNLEDPKYSSVFPAVIKHTKESNEDKYEMEDITFLVGIEDKIKEDCENFKNLLKLMATYDGEDVIEFT